MSEELTYWLALTHIPKLRTKKKNELVVRLFEQGKTIKDFFHLDQADWLHNYNLDTNDIELFINAKKELSNYAFLVEDLLEQGYNILPITSKEYSPILKRNLGRTFAPPVIYSKGNLQLMQESSVAIVGSRKANEHSLNFTDNIARKATKDYKVVVSGFAKGVDKQALDSALKYKGQSIIVLPQGITTFNSGFKKYYKQIIEGDVLVISTFYPKAPWSVQFAMARNPIIYGLASEVYVAESSNKGGTWSGVIDGLKKGRTIYIRTPNLKEKNANNLLISKGGRPVDKEGNFEYNEIRESKMSQVSESFPEADESEKRIIEYTKKGSFSAKKIVETLDLDWTPRKVSNFLKTRKDTLTIKGKPLKFAHKNSTIQSPPSLFN